MKVWNISDKVIKQLYNNQAVIIQPNSVIDLPDDAVVFLLNKKEVRGQGLVQLKEGDNKEDRYKEARLNIKNWAQEKYADYERHCEEREEAKGRSLRPHEAILEYEQTIKDYNKWVEDGEVVDVKLKGVVGEKKIYACAICPEEFSIREEYLEHLDSHKEKVDDVSRVSDEGEGKG